MKANVKRTLNQIAREEALRKHFAQPAVDSVLVSVDFSRGVDTSVLIVGRKNEKGVVDICHSIQGEEAEKLYYQLLGGKAEEFEKEVAANREAYLKKQVEDHEKLEEIINNRIEEKKAEAAENVSDSVQI